MQCLIKQTVELHCMETTGVVVVSLRHTSLTMEWEALHQGIGGRGEALFIGENVLGQYLLVNYKCPGRHYSPVNNVRGTSLGEL